MFDLSPIQLIIVLVIAVLVLGPSRLPQFSRAVGKGLRDFKGALAGDHFDDDPTPAAKAEAAEPPAPATTTAAAAATAQPVTTATAGPAEPAGSSDDVLEGIVVSGDAPPTAPPAADK
jgi:sec-independent protein translocase protein TatA